MFIPLINIPSILTYSIAVASLDMTQRKCLKKYYF